MFIVLHDIEGYSVLADGVAEDGVFHDTLDAALADVKYRVSVTSNSAEDYTIFVPHKVKMTLSID